MRLLLILVAGLAIALVPDFAAAQKKKKPPEEEFLAEKPTLGDAFPNLTVYSPDGKEFKTSELRGQYSVLTFGCLT